MNGLTGRINTLFEWISNLVYVNVLWICFTLMGLVVFGLMPATTAMFHITRKWVRGERDFSIFQLFWSTYKSEFFKIQGLGIVYAIIGFFLIFNFTFFSDHQIVIGKFFVIGLLVIYFLSLLFLFPVYVHFDMKLLEYLKSTFVISSAHIFQSLVIVCGCTFILVLSSFFPASFFFLSGSLSALWITWIAYHWGFMKISEGVTR
jgi:uncharacterized membrane protein YesL